MYLIHAFIIYSDSVLKHVNFEQNYNVSYNKNNRFVFESGLYRMVIIKYYVT